VVELNRQKQTAAKGGLTDMDKNLLVGILGLLIGIIAIAVPLVFKEKKKLQKNKDDGLYYEDGDPDNPYCPNCYTKKRKTILIDRNSRRCPKCKTAFERPKFAIEVIPRKGPKFRI
jgi:hypothetical protein